MSIVHDFKSIKRIIDRQEQKAEFEAKNPKVEPSMYGWPYGVAVPLKSMAHPEWPYTGTPFEWRKFGALSSLPLVVDGELKTFKI